MEIRVTTTIDEDNDASSGSGRSLREALDEAGVDDRIVFDPALTENGVATFDLPMGALSITQGVIIDGDIDGNGTPDVTIDAGVGEDRAFDIRAHDVVLNGLSVTGGFGDTSGGAIRNYSYTGLVISNSNVYDNESLDDGGGLYLGPGSDAIVVNSSLYNNEAAYGSGGAIGHFTSGSLSVINSTISNNYSMAKGGGLYVSPGDFSIANSTITQNDANDDGGGLYVGDDASGSLTNTVVTENSAGSSGGDNIGGLGSFDEETSSYVGGANLLDAASKTGGKYAHLLSNASPDGNALIDGGDEEAPVSLDEQALGIDIDADGTRSTLEFVKDLAVDQRGSGFDRIVGDTVDIGSIEQQPSEAETEESEESEESEETEETGESEETAKQTNNRPSPPPPEAIAENDRFNVREDETVGGLDDDLLRNDTDVSEISSFKTGDLTGTLQIVNGALVYTASGFDALATGETREDIFPYTATGEGGSDSARVTIVVTGVNDVPEPTPDAIRVQADAPSGAGNLLDNDEDPETNRSDLKVVAVNGKADAIDVPVALDAGGQVQVGESGDVRVTPGPSYVSLPAGESLSERLTYTLSDPEGATAISEFVVTIAGVNDAPEARDDATEVGTSGAPVSGNVIANDSDPDGEPIHVTAVNGDTSAVGSTITLPSDARVTVSADGEFRYEAAASVSTTAPGQIDGETVTYTVTDPLGATGQASLTFLSVGAGFDDDLLFGGSAITERLDNLGKDLIIPETAAAADTIDGAEGNDLIGGGGLNDVISGGSGRDTLYGEGGDDTLIGGANADLLDGGIGADIIRAGGGNDKAMGGDGADELLGGDGADALFGDAGADRLNGNTGNDVLLGGDGNDTLAGGAGIDGLLGGAGSDRFEIGPDTDMHVIGDFESGVDLLAFDDVDALTAAEVLASAEASPSGVELNVQDTTVLLLNTQISELAAGDFDFG